MYRTIQLSSCVLVQGEFVEALADGSVVIRDGVTTYRGRPINKRAKGFMPEMSAGACDGGARLS